MRVAKKIILVFILIVFCCSAVLQYRIVTAPSRIHPVASEYILVLGYALINGTYPDEWLQTRLRKGLELYNSGFGKYIVVSGGQGQKDHLPVSEAMKRWLVENGIPEDKILVEDQSHTTHENMVFSKKIISDHSVIIVTNDFHIFRSMWIAGKYFESFSGSSAESTGTIKRALGYVREDMAIWKYLLLGR